MHGASSSPGIHPFSQPHRGRRAGRQARPRDPRQLCRPQASQSARRARSASTLDLSFHTHFLLLGQCDREFLRLTHPSPPATRCLPLARRSTSRDQPLPQRAQPQTQALRLDGRARPHHRKAEPWVSGVGVKPLGLWPERLVADTGYGSAEMLNWLVNDRGIEPHIPVFDKSKRTDDTFSREDFVYDHASDTYRCPGGKTLRRYRRQFTVPRIGVMKDNSLRYRASKHDCEPCPLKPRCCPNAPVRKVPRSIYEGARDLARKIAKTEAYQTSRYQRKKVEMLFAHLKRILKLDRLRLRGPCGARDEFHLAAIAQNLRKLAKLIPGQQAIPAT